MYYEPELRMLRDTFRACRISTGIAELSDPLPGQSDNPFQTFLAGRLDPDRPLSDYIPTVESGVLYRLRDPFSCCYSYLLLPELPRQAALVIGPYLSEPPSHQQFLEWAESNRLPPARLRELELCYSTVPILQDTSHLFALLDTFCQRLWGSVTVQDLGQNHSFLTDHRQESTPDRSAVLLNIENLEQRYRCENELMEAVSHGQEHKVSQLLSSISSFFFEQRVPDPVRNLKNYCIVMNTLLRKAAEKGGVHPVHLDRISSDFAVRIEQVSAVSTIETLMPQMFRAYCRLVQEYAVKDYSPPVQKAILYIDANLSEDLSLHALAETLSISDGYLSMLFRKETGQTLTDYVNRRRIDYACHLLKTTRLQIQTVAQHCGIVDVQYFSKVFKRITGTTPKTYRNQNN